VQFPRIKAAHLDRPPEPAARIPVKLVTIVRDGRVAAVSKRDEDSSAGPGSKVPDADGPVIGSGRDQGAIGSDDDAPDNVNVASQGDAGRAGGDVPDPGGAVARGRG